MMTGEARALAHAEASTSDNSWFRSFGHLLQLELSPYPGRSVLVLRMVLACTFVMFCIIVFRIPGAVLGAYCPMLVSRNNFQATKRSALWIAAACTLGTVEVILGAMACTGSPMLHLVWVWVTLFAVFYLVSILRVYEAALALGLFITNAISIWDQPFGANLRLNQTLYMLLAILLGCATTVLIEFLFTRTHLAGLVIEGIQERLTLTRRTLQEYLRGELQTSGRFIRDLRRHAARGNDTLHAAIEQAEYPIETEQRLSTAVALAGRLMELCVALAEYPAAPSASDVAVGHALSESAARLNEQLAKGELPTWIDLDHEHQPSSPILLEMERTLDLLTDSFSGSMWDSDLGPTPSEKENSGSRLFVRDAFSALEHMKFTIRGTLSAILCYMLYMSTGWTGLNASIATCILTALPVTGASRHKQLMRFAGVVFGACIVGFGVQAAILPQIDSILSYTLLFATVVCIGAWVGTSGPRLSFCGVQIVLAYELVNLGRFSINPSLVPARDTILGIALGICAMWLVYDHLWITSSTESVRVLLTSTLRRIAALHISPHDPAPLQDKHLEHETRGIVQDFDKIRSMVDTSIFEAFPRQAAEERIVQQATEHIPQLRAALMIKTGLLHHSILVRGGVPVESVQHATRQSGDQLRQLADDLESNEFWPYPLPAFASFESVPESAGTSHAPLEKEALEDATEARLIACLKTVMKQIAATSPISGY